MKSHLEVSAGVSVSIRREYRSTCMHFPEKKAHIFPQKLVFLARLTAWCPSRAFPCDITRRLKARKLVSRIDFSTQDTIPISLRF